MDKISIKYFKWAQGAGGAGWNQHVSPWLRRKANKRLRRLFSRGLPRRIIGLEMETQG